MNTRTLVLRNQQRGRRVDLRRLRRLVKTLLEEVLALSEYDLGIYLVGASEITRLNETFLRHTGPTDVITFDYAEAAPGPRGLGILPKQVARGLRGLGIPPEPAEQGSGARRPCHGEVFVCVPEAVAQARRFRVPWQSELVRYIVHGLLHLRGLDDSRPAARRRMKRAEDCCLRELARRFELTGLHPG